MPTQHADLFAALAAPFDASEVKTRSQAGRTFSYVTARSVMNRLDDVLGPEGWWDAYRTSGENSIVCRLTIRIQAEHGPMELSKEDAGGFAGMADSGDDDKSGYSDALKRAAVKWGVGRYLYRDGVPAFVKERVGAETLPPPRRDHDHDQPQRAPQRDAQPPSDAHAGSNSGNGQRQYDVPPKSGKALFAWTKEQEQRYEVGLLKYLNAYMKLQDFPGRMIDLTPEQVAQCYAEAQRKLAGVQQRGQDAYEDAISN
jgi:hypothetical protein